MGADNNTNKRISSTLDIPYPDFAKLFGGPAQSFAT